MAGGSGRAGGQADGSIRLRFDASSHPDPASRAAAWREAMSPTADLVFGPGERDDLSAQIDVHRLGDVLLVVSRCTSVTMVRDRRTLARTGHTNVILDLLTAGSVTGTLGARPIAVGPGDCFILDLKGTFRLKVATRYIGVVLPRAAFRTPSGGAGVHGIVMPAGGADARLLGPLLEHAAAEAPRLPPAQAAALGHGLAELIAALVGARLGGGAEARPDATRRVPTLARVRRHIDRHAAEPALDAAALAAAFGLSRTALYRLCQPAGGVAAMIRERRAALARGLLDGTEADGTVEAMARRCGFGNARALRRALQAVHRAPPSRLRRQPLAPEAGTREHRVAIDAWLDP